MPTPRLQVLADFFRLLHLSFFEFKSCYQSHPIYQSDHFNISSDSVTPPLFIQSIFITWSQVWQILYLVPNMLSLPNYTFLNFSTVCNHVEKRVQWNLSNDGTLMTLLSQMPCLCTIQPLKSGHLTNQDTFFCSKGVQIREVLTV